MLGIALLFLATGCSDPMDEITSLILGRNLSPVGLEARITNKTDVVLTWELAQGPTGYVIEGYANDSLSFEGTPAMTMKVSAKDVPVTIKGLDGETKYSFRIKAVTEGDADKDSKWSGVYVMTDAEQIINTPAETDIKAHSINIHWPQGQEAQKIVVTDDEGNIAAEHMITAEEIAAGMATIEGLSPETHYTATMYRANGKQRGKITFTTAIELAENDILVKEGESLTDAIAAAPADARLVVMPGNYMTKNEEGVVSEITINKNITIKGLRQNQHPVINGRFVITDGASLSLDQVTLDGTGTSGDQAFVYKADGTYEQLNITNSEIKNFVKGFFYINVVAQVNLINIDNCIISKIDCNGGDMFDSRKGSYKKFTLTNSTIYNSCDARDMIRMDDASKNFTGVSPEILVSHCTLNGVSNNNSKRLLYVRYAGHSITFTDNLITNTDGIFSNQSKTAQPTFGNNNYFKAPGFFTGGSDISLIFDDGGAKLDPQYANADAGDFTVKNEDVKFKKYGDPRWLK